MVIVTRRQLQIVLALLWGVDGLLQLQPHMFTRSFATEVIAPTAQGQPALIAGLIHLTVRIILLQPAAFNAVFGGVQLALAAGLIYRKTTRWALAGSIVWGLSVWATGEGFGGLLAGGANLITGEPGAALLYAVLALAAWPGLASTDANPDAPARWSRWAWAALWLSGAVFQLLPGHNSSDDVYNLVMNNAMDAPHWLAAVDSWLANPIPVDNVSFPVHLITIEVVIGLGVLSRSRRLACWAVGLGTVVSALFWVVGQGFGQPWTGLATDPSTAPLVVVLGLAALGSMRPVPKVVITEEITPVPV